MIPSAHCIPRRTLLTAAAAATTAAAVTGRPGLAAAATTFPIPVPTGPLVFRDDFTQGLPAPWALYHGDAGTSGGTYLTSAVTTSSAGLQITATGTSVGGMSRHSPQLYGVFVWRGVSSALSSSGIGGSLKVDKPAIGLWPEPPTTWAQGGELDAMETSDARTQANFTDHWFANGVTQKQHQEHIAIDMTAPHDYGILWTSNGLVWFVDGTIAFAGAAGSNLVIPAYPMHPFMQINGFAGNTNLVCTAYEQYRSPV